MRYLFVVDSLDKHRQNEKEQNEKELIEVFSSPSFFLLFSFLGNFLL